MGIIQLTYNEISHSITFEEFLQVISVLNILIPETIVNGKLTIGTIMNEWEIKEEKDFNIFLLEYI